MAIADLVSAGVEQEGTLRAQDLVLPPSEFWSKEFRAAHVRRAVAAATADGLLKVPARTASREEWDKFDADCDRQMAEPLARGLDRYQACVQETTIGGIRVGVVTPKQGLTRENEDRVLINLHGGGYYANRGLSFGLLESIPISSIGRFTVITIDYRQAPLHRYPAASEDVEVVYRELLGKYGASAIGLFGCSAGGDLAAQAVGWLRRKELPRPGAVGILSFAPVTSPWPWGKEGDSRIWRVGMVPKSSISYSDAEVLDPLTWYLESVRANDAIAFPGSSDAMLATFPPTLLLVGTREYWLSAAAVAHARFLRLGVDSSLYVMEGAYHAAHVGGETPEAYDANAYVARWFNQRLSKEHSAC